jgi:uncharacterized protein (DUF2225 family)
MSRYKVHTDEDKVRVRIRDYYYRRKTAECSVCKSKVKVEQMDKINKRIIAKRMKEINK